MIQWLKCLAHNNSKEGGNNLMLMRQNLKHYSFENAKAFSTFHNRETQI